MVDEVENTPLAGDEKQTRYENEEKAALAQLRGRRGLIPRIYKHVRRWFVGYDVPREARDDWLRVKYAFDRLKSRLLNGGSVTAQQIDNLAFACACLNEARETTDLYEAWRNINQASETLCHVGDDEEQAFLLQRFKAWEPILQTELLKIYKPDTTDEMKENRQSSNSACCELTIHSQHWQLVNQSNSLRIKLRSRLAWIMMIVVLIAVAAATILHTRHGLKNEIDYPFIWVSVFGLLGGALSAFLSARNLRPTAVDYRSTIGQVILRLALGAGGAFVLYSALIFPDFLKEELANTIKLLPGVILLGVVGGFSERLFKGMIEQFEARVLPNRQPPG